MAQRKQQTSNFGHESFKIERAVYSLKQGRFRLTAKALKTCLSKPYSVVFALSAIAAVVLLKLFIRLVFNVDINESVDNFETERQFTVRMNTFRRNHDLKVSVDSIAQCGAVAQIQIVWSDQSNPPPDLSIFAPHSRGLVRFERHATDSLNNRFKPLTMITTEAVFSVDDDVLFSCDDLMFAFETWTMSKDTMVGFVPRLVTYESLLNRHEYKSWWFTWWNGAYNLVLTKAAFFHRKYLAYYSMLSDEILMHINNHRNCEDIAMSMVVAKYSKSPPIWVSGKVKELGGVGISSGSDHTKTRSQCIDHFNSVLGENPLVLSRHKYIPAKKMWFWTMGT